MFLLCHKLFQHAQIQTKNYSIYFLANLFPFLFTGHARMPGLDQLTPGHRAMQHIPRDAHNWLVFL